MSVFLFDTQHDPPRQGQYLYKNTRNLGTILLRQSSNAFLNG